MPSSNYLRGKLIDESLRNINYLPAPVVYVALHTADPTVNGLPATEVNAAWYQRQPVTFGAQSTAGQTFSTNDVTYAPVSGSPVTVTHFAVWDSQTLGNLLYFGTLATSKTFAVTDVPSFLAGQIAVSAM